MNAPQAAESNASTERVESTGFFNWQTTQLQRYGEMESDPSTGLRHTDWRKYDDWQGRWTTTDPAHSSMSVGDPQSFNRYAYVGNDPVNMVDPSGLCGVNPITDQPGFTNNPKGVPGHLRPGVGGAGYFGAPRRRAGTHKGLDISGISGQSSVYANGAGTVTFAGRAGDAGNLVIINQGSGIETRYGHLSSFADGLRAGDMVDGSDEIGIVGQTGNASGQSLSEAHVHFAVKINGGLADPAKYLNGLCPLPTAQTRPSSPPIPPPFVPLPLPGGGGGSVDRLGPPP